PLVKVDRMSMAHSLEVRCPLLDHRLVEMAFRVPASRKHAWHQSKILLRQLAQQRLPGEVWTLPKRGFTVPIGAWIRDPFAGRYQDEGLSSVARIGTHLDVGHLHRLFDAHRRGERDHGYVLWAAWVLERWLQLQSTVPAMAAAPRDLPPSGPTAEPSTI